MRAQGPQGQGRFWRMKAGKSLQEDGRDPQTCEKREKGWDGWPKRQWRKQEV